MPEIAIQLDPERLANPDADLRYVLPARIEVRAPGLIFEDGYDYGPVSHRMTVFLRTPDLAAALACVLEVLASETVLGNRLLDSGVVVATSPCDSSDDERDYTIVHPPGGAPFSLS